MRGGGMSKVIVKRVLKIAERLKETQQMNLLFAGPAEFDQFFKRQVAVWGGVVRENGIKAQ